MISFLNWRVCKRRIITVTSREMGTNAHWHPSPVIQFYKSSMTSFCDKKWISLSINVHPTPLPGYFGKNNFLKAFKGACVQLQYEFLDLFSRSDILISQYYNRILKDTNHLGSSDRSWMILKTSNFLHSLMAPYIVRLQFIQSLKNEINYWNRRF